VPFGTFPIDPFAIFGIQHSPFDIHEDRIRR
jgi:hypothetical protein